MLSVCGTTRQRRCFQEGYLTYVYGEEQNTAVVSKEVHQNMQKLAGHLSC